MVTTQPPGLLPAGTGIEIPPALSFSRERPLPDVSTALAPLTGEAPVGPHGKDVKQALAPLTEISGGVDPAGGGFQHDRTA